MKIQHFLYFFVFRLGNAFPSATKFLNRRMRRNVVLDDDDTGDVAHTNDDNSIECENSVMSPRAPSSTTTALSQTNLKSQFLDGAIVRVALENFVTYDRCTFSPGPGLNLVIGANGTGKSSIVCALALGLGGAPSLLGRAKDITEFVKHGTSKATIEIELFRKNKANVVIKRVIQKREGAHSSWMINKKGKSHREVLAVVKDLNIQVDNLWYSGLLWSVQRCA